MSISYRLKYLVDLIPNGENIIADIGTDHGYLPIYSLQSKKAKLVYASDINLEPLNSAKNNIDKENLTSKVIFFLSDGLNFTFDKNIKNIDYVTISGLGSSTILEILKNDNKKISNFLICSNTQIKKIREWTILKNYLIEFENFIIDNKRPYWVILINKNKKAQTINNVTFGDYKWFVKNKEYINYLNNNIKKYEEIIKNIKTEKILNNFKNKINNIKEYLDNGIDENN